MTPSTYVLRLRQDFIVVQPAAQRYMMIALAIAISLHLGVMGSYYYGAVRGAEEEERALTVRIIKYTDLGPPPSLASVAVPPIAVTQTKIAKPSVGIPVPVPDAAVSPEQTIATQAEMSQVTSPVSEELLGEGGRIQIEVPIQDEDMPDIDAFVPVEREPMVAKRVKPEYPEVARRAGIEGVVWVKVLVDREGKPRKAVVIKSEGGEVLEEAAVKAAMKYVFTPAVMNQGPVACWVVIPFRFRLRTVTPS